MKRINRSRATINLPTFSYNLRPRTNTMKKNNKRKYKRRTKRESYQEDKMEDSFEIFFYEEKSSPNSKNQDLKKMENALKIKNLLKQFLHD